MLCEEREKEAEEGLCCFKLLGVDFRAVGSQSPLQSCTMNNVQQLSPFLPGVCGQMNLGRHSFIF